MARSDGGNHGPTGARLAAAVRSSMACQPPSTRLATGVAFRLAAVTPCAVPGRGYGARGVCRRPSTPRHSAIAGARPEQRPSTDLAGHAVLFADLESPPFPAPGGCPGRRCALAAHRSAYRSPLRALRRASLLPATAQGRGEDLRIPAVFPAPENGPDRRLGEHRFVQLRSLEPALQPGSQPGSTGPRIDPVGSGEFRTGFRVERASQPGGMEAPTTVETGQAAGVGMGGSGGGESAGSTRLIPILQTPET